MHPAVPLLLASTLLLPFVDAGSADAPELTDAEGDCAFVAGNEYLDVVAAWISDETATHFAVNLALAKWGPVDALPTFSGLTVQFQHQGKQFGVAAFFDGQSWDYSNGYIDIETGETSGFRSAQGSFAPGTPAVLTVQFDKANFPHTDAADDKLVAFQAGTADMKSAMPGFLGAPVAFPPLGCDTAQSSATYTFQVGEHRGHGGGSGAGDATEADGAEPSSPGDGTEARTGDALDPQAAPRGNETPGFAPALLALVAAGIARVRGRADRRGRR